MKFKSAGGDILGSSFWITENGRYEIIANDWRITIQTQKIGSSWMDVMPLRIDMEDRGITAFVMRGIMDAVAPLPNDTDQFGVRDAIQAYMDAMCPDVRREAIPLIGTRWLSYPVRRDHIRRYLKDHEVHAKQHS